ncbi:E3 ubiquitin-protein ligase RGLG2-like isoform X2 [Pyrus x bretschneideri]|uniref:E3 ubiquitin-protein ligase RGLG2-like isoform X2 n=1 Tax=Pyrus x bretschneideri TaxID=225117 RepID=UPI00202F3398|nr:E3 ubiquitin-protein ligase RGLG2-like isoform X2 [Pyrus x bretschneideri]XP_048423937.1 E3 ubiquitin-protein ligase RGLG2-like isoform X2 [Pyrus x bretschneideri]
MGGCISAMPRRLWSSRLRLPQVQFPDPVKIQSGQAGNFSQRVPLCPFHYRETSSGTTAPPAASSTNENEVCTICYDNPMDIALGCKHRICSTCEQKVYHCPHCQTPILTKLKLICGDEKFWCPICLANPKGMVFGCGHQTCLECARDLQSCPKCGSVGTPMQLY